MYVTDGYGNARLHRFTADGELTARRASRSGPVEFELPHGVTWRDGRLYVSDRFNDRVQLLDPTAGSWASSRRASPTASSSTATAAC